jgi:hypothetical protein
MNNNITLYHGLVLFRNAMLPFIIERLRAFYGNGWWKAGVARVLGEDTINNLDKQFQRRYKKTLASVKRPGQDVEQMLDIGHFLPIIQGNWKQCFTQTFEEQNKKKVEVWLSEIIEARNAVAHPEDKPLGDQDTWRTFDTLSRLLEAVDKDCAEQIRKIAQQLRGQQEEGTQEESETSSLWLSLKDGPHDYAKGLKQLRKIILQKEGNGSEGHRNLNGHERQLTSFLYEKRLRPGNPDGQLENSIERVLHELDRISLHYYQKPFHDLCLTPTTPVDDSDTRPPHDTIKKPESNSGDLEQEPFTAKKLVKFKLQLGHLLSLEFEARVLDSPMGEQIGNTKLPYTPEQLVAVLKALQIPLYQQEIFTSAQRDALKQLGLLTNSHFVSDLHQRVGKALFRSLLTDQEVYAAFQMARTLARTNNRTVAFQLRFDENGTELARYPWELLHDGRRALLPSQTIELVRYISYPEATTPLSAPAPLRLLYITARPYNLQELPPDSERQTTRRSLQPLEKDGQLHIDDLPHATYDALLDYLDDYKPHILHFDGHGRFNRQCHVCHTFYHPHITKCESCSVALPEPQGYLAFEKEDGTVHWISSQTVGHLFGSSLRLAVLSACHSGTVRGETLFGGVGPALIQAGVPAVVATQLPITVGSANLFAKGFYRALARYESLATAVNAGRRRLFNTKEWFIPVLYLRSQDDEGHLFTKP